MGAQTGRHVLVVEDETSINDVVATALRYHGHVVTQVDNGTSGLQTAMHGAFDRASTRPWPTACSYRSDGGTRPEAAEATRVPVWAWP